MVKLLHKDRGTTDKAQTVVPHFSPPPPPRPPRLAFLAWGGFHARLRFARSTIPEEKMGTTRSLPLLHNKVK